MSHLSSSPVWTWMKIEQQKRSVFQQYNCVKIVHKFAEAIAHRIRLNGSTVYELVKSAILCASDHDGERCIRSCRNVVRWSRSWFVARRYRYHWTLIGNPSPEIQCRAIPFQPLGCSPQGPTVEPRAVLFLKPVEAGSSNLAWSMEQGDATVNFRGQEVKGQGHTTSTLDLETWRKHHSQPFRLSRFFSLGWVMRISPYHCGLCCTLPLNYAENGL